jgi:hypothetical protein
VKEISVYKQGLRTLLRPRTESAQLEQRIQAVVRRLSQVSFEASRLLNLHVMHMLEAGEELPLLEETYIRQFFSLILGSLTPEGVDDRLRHIFCTLHLQCRCASYCPTEKILGSSQCLTYLVKEYVVNLNNHIPEQFKSSAKRIVRQLLKSKGVSKSRTDHLVFKMLEAFEDGATLPIPPDAREDLTAVYEDMKRNATSQYLMLKRMFEHISTVEEWNDPIEAKQKKRKERKKRKAKEGEMAGKKKNMKKKKTKGAMEGKKWKGGNGKIEV